MDIQDNLDFLHIDNLYIFNNIIYCNKLFNMKFNDTEPFSNYYKYYKSHYVDILSEDDLPVNKMIKNSFSNIFISRPLHPCYCHTIIDYLFINFCIILDIKKNFNININKIYVTNSRRYYNKNNFYNLHKLLGLDLLNLDKNICYKLDNVFFPLLGLYPSIEWSYRSPFNGFYENRKLLYPIIDDITMTDNLLKYKHQILKHYNLENKEINNNIILINRNPYKYGTYGRYFSKDDISFIRSIIDNKYTLEVIVLEDLEHKNQIKLFSENTKFICYHGSAVANLIVANNNYKTSIIEIKWKNRNTMNHCHERLCSLLNINYYKLNSINEVNNIIHKFI